VAIDFENDGTWIDVSGYLQSATIRRGSSRVESPITRYEAGTALLTLDNSDRRFDPTNLTGPYTTPSGTPGSGTQQALATSTLTYGHGVSIAVASLDPEVVEASLVDSTSASSQSTSYTCAKPTGLVAGQHIIAVQSADWGSRNQMGTPSGGSTWISLGSIDSGDYKLHTKAWWKVATSADVAASNFGFTQANFSDGTVIIATVKDGTGIPTFDAVYNDGTAYFDTPGLVPSGAADYELRFVSGTGGDAVNGWDWSATDGPYTEAEQVQSATWTTSSMAHKTLSGLVILSGGTWVKPMRPVRVRATWSGTTYDLFRGYVDSWDIEWNGPNYSTVSVPCTDAFKIFANYDRVGSGTSPSEATGTRINRILDSVGWPSAVDGGRDIETGDVVLSAVTPGNDGNALDELMNVADTEVGELYMTPDGKVFFRNRSGVTTDTRSTDSNATFGDSGSELRYANLTFSNDDTQLANRVIVTRVGGTPQIADDVASQNEFLIKTFERSDLLLTSDVAALNYAQYVLSLSAQPELRFETLEIMPQRSESTLFPQALNRIIGDRITVRRRPPGDGTLIEQEAIIRGIEHEIIPGKWVTRWTLQSSGAAGSFFIIGHSTLGKLNHNALGF
jgi:hypothetical protein